MVNLDNNSILKELSSATNDIAKGELVQLDSFGQLKITESELNCIKLFVDFFKLMNIYQLV